MCRLSNTSFSQWLHIWGYLELVPLIDLSIYNCKTGEMGTIPVHVPQLDITGAVNLDKQIPKALLAPCRCFQGQNEAKEELLRKLQQWFCNHREM